jgi:hypothetical protein
MLKNAALFLFLMKKKFPADCPIHFIFPRKESNVFWKSGSQEVPAYSKVREHTLTSVGTHQIKPKQ